MKYLKYILRNALRNKLRSALTILSLCISLSMMTVLWGYLAMQDVWGSEAAKYNRGVVMNIQGFSGPVPYSYLERIRSTPGVLAAVPYSWFGGVYKDEKMPFAQFATDAAHVFRVWDEFTIDPAQLEAWQENRQGCVVDRRTAERRGWQIGEHIPLKGTYYNYDLDLELCGFFDAPTPTDSLWFHWAYLDEGLRSVGAPGSGNCGTVFFKAETSQQLEQICETIDRTFESSENPTRTQTESAFARMFTEMLGNIQVYIMAIGLFVIFSLTLVAANAMAMAMRERTTEVAVLKAIGFQRSQVLSLILGESCLIAMVGGILGVAGGSGLLQMFYVLSPQLFPIDLKSLAGPWMASGIVAAVVIGLLSGAVPAIRAAQLPVVDGLRRVV